MEIRPIDANALVASLQESYKELRELCDSMKEGDGRKEVFQGELVTFCEAILRTKGMPTLDYAPRQQWISVKEQPEPSEDGEYWCYGYWFGSGRKQFETAEYLGEWKIVNNFILTHWMPLPSTEGLNDDT